MYDATVLHQMYISVSITWEKINCARYLVGLQAECMLSAYEFPIRDSLINNVVVAQNVVYNVSIKFRDCRLRQCEHPATNNKWYLIFDTSLKNRLKIPEV